MAKKTYITPAWESDPGDVVIIIAASQGTMGDDSQFTWDPLIDPDDIDMFWASYDETDLAYIDTDGNLYISKAEFDAWYAATQPW